MLRLEVGETKATENTGNRQLSLTDDVKFPHPSLPRIINLSGVTKILDWERVIISPRYKPRFLTTGLTQFDVAIVIRDTEEVELCTTQEVDVVNFYGFSTTVDASVFIDNKVQQIKTGPRKMLSSMLSSPVVYRLGSGGA